MTFNPLMTKAVSGLMPFFEATNSHSVIELGSQTLTVGFKERPDIETAEQFYKALGFERYEAIDTDGTGTMNLDLNEVIFSTDKYGLVTNNGTGEHVFNQAALLETMHNLCEPGGLMLHVMPWINFGS